MDKEINTKPKTNEQQEDDELKDFPIDIKRDIIDIINDSPSLVQLGDKEFCVKDMRYYSLFRICRLALEMKKGDEDLTDDNKIVMALCTDLDAMCEIMAIILCNHLFKPSDSNDELGAKNSLTRNDRYITIMKAKIMNSTFEVNQWANIIIGALKSIDLSGFFLLKKSVNMLTDSIMERKKKSTETASQFMEALALQTPQTS